MTPHITQCNMSSGFDRSFTDFASAEPVYMYICISCLAQIYDDADDTSSKIGSLLHLDTAAQGNEILTFQNGTQVKSKASIHSTIKKSIST